MFASSRSHMVQTWQRFTVTVRSQSSRITKFWHEGYRQALLDLPSKDSVDARCFFIFLWFVALCICFSVLSSTTYQMSLAARSACQPDGTFELGPKKFQYWTSGYFQISIGFGDLTFTQAKVIDIIWDVIYGRGGQALLAFISWRVFAMYLTTSTTPVTFNTYRAVFLQTEPSFIGISRIIRDFARRLRLQSTTTMVFMTATMTFIVAFPTLGSAMTGYSGNVKAFVPDYDGNYMAFESFSYILYVVHDGWRINLDNNTVLTYKNRDRSDPVLSDRLLANEYPVHGILWNVSRYIDLYGLHGLNNTSSSWINNTLPSPVLNISGSHLARPSGNSDWTNETAQLEVVIDKSRMTWTYANQLYNSSYINSHGSCQTIASYKWGFSFLQLVVVMAMLILWTIGISTMWIRSHNIMRRQGGKEVAGEHKAIFELAEAMHAQIISLGMDDVDDLPALKESDLRCRINKELRGGSISYDHPGSPPTKPQDNTFPAWSARLKLRNAKLWAWVISEKWCLSAFFLSFSWCCALAFTFIHAFRAFVVSLPLAFVFSVYFGSTKNSRAVLFFFPFCLCSLLFMSFSL